MMTYIKAKLGMDILEPSAGDGALIKALHEYQGKDISVSYCELMPINRIKLDKIKNAVMVCEDFLEHPDTYRYDYIVANPPFTKNQDIDHIRKMYSLLKTNGRLVTLASPSWTFGHDKKQAAFRKWLDDVGAYQEELPEGTFKASGTSIRTVLLIIDRLETEEPLRSQYPIPAPNIVIGAPSLSSTKTNDKMKKITIPASPLIAVLKKVKEVIAKHSTITVLSNALIKVRRQDIQIVASDLAVTILATIEVANDGDYGYEYLLPFDFLYNIGNLINGLDLSIEINTITKKVDGKKVDVHNAILSTYTDTFNQDDLDNTSDWPAMPEFPQENSIGIGGDFILWLNKAIDTVSPDSTNQAMQKIFIGIANEGLAMASTNKHVIFEKTFPAESKHVKNLLVNTKIAKALKGFKETSISYSDTHIAFVSNGITMIGTLQDEAFPKYQDLFPTEIAGNLKLSLSELTGIMQKAALTKKPATIWLKREIGHIVVDSFDEIYNRKVTVRIGADYSGDCEQIIVDPQNMLLLLGQVEYVSISLLITGPNKPIIITSESDPSYRALTMPMIL